MKSVIGTGTFALAILLAGCGGDNSGGNASNVNLSAPLPQIKAPNGDWSQTVVETPEGGFRMGNPGAPVKLVEYASVTCPHCAEFSERASEELINEYVKSGQVSWEFRHFMIFPTDPGLSLLTRCQGPGAFFALTEQLYADQANWSQRVQSLPQAELQRLGTMPPQQQATAIVKSAGLDQFFRQRGVPQAKIDACLADQQALQKLADLTALGQKEGVTGTPSFFINGELVNYTSAAIWPDLEPAIRRAVGG